MRKTFVLLLTLALLAAACGGDEAQSTTTGDASTTSGESTTTSEDPTTSSSSTTSSATTSSTTTTTTEAAGGGDPSPLNGLPAEDPEFLDRRVLAVKVDNHPNARPQSGLPEADAVVEILVEGGITRFIALFHDNDSAYLGPTRSVRPTDPSIVKTVDAVFATSGGRDSVVAFLAGLDIPILAEGAEGFFRIGSRAAPHNLYVDTEGLRRAAAGRGYHDEFGGPLYEVAAWEEPPEEEATRVDVGWPYGHDVSWVFEDGQYRRFEGTRQHRWVEGEGGTPEQIAADVLVVLEGRYYVANTGHPSTDVVGTGDAHIFFDGRVRHATWTRDSVEEPFELAAGIATVTVPPGFPWVTLLPSNSSIDWTP